MPQLSWLLVVAAIVVIALVLVGSARRRGREQAVQEQQIRRRQTWRVVSAIVLLGLIVLFAVVNSHTVEIDWLVATTRAPMIVVIALSGAGGLLIGALIANRGRSGQD